jgi:predicted phosphatase
MKILNDNPTTAFDVDDTLLFWHVDEDLPTVTVECDGRTQELNVHTEHINQLKKHKLRGHQIIVWSAGGAAWALAAVKALGIEDYVDVVMSKPVWYYDDAHCSKWMGDPEYLHREKYLTE